MFDGASVPVLVIVGVAAIVLWNAVEGILDDD
jgi:hypothetical protein